MCLTQLVFSTSLLCPGSCDYTSTITIFSTILCIQQSEGESKVMVMYTQFSFSVHIHTMTPVQISLLIMSYTGMVVDTSFHNDFGCGFCWSVDGRLVVDWSAT